MGLPIIKTEDGGEEVETLRRGSEGTAVDSSKVDAEGHARDVPPVKVAMKGKSWISRITGVAP
jgi:hypothetical protein